MTTKQERQEAWKEAKKEGVFEYLFRPSIDLIKKKPLQAFYLFFIKSVLPMFIIMVGLQYLDRQMMYCQFDSIEGSTYSSYQETLPAYNEFLKSRMSRLDTNRAMQEISDSKLNCSYNLRRFCEDSLWCKPTH